MTEWFIWNIILILVEQILMYYEITLFIVELIKTLFYISVMNEEEN